LPQGKSIRAEMDVGILVRSIWHSPLVIAIKTSKYKAVGLAAFGEDRCARPSANQNLLKFIS
jgi:hypothetical protein